MMGKIRFFFSDIFGLPGHSGRFPPTQKSKKAEEGKFDTPTRKKKRNGAKAALPSFFSFSAALLSWLVKFAFACLWLQFNLTISTDWRLILVFISFPCFFHCHRYHQSHQYQVIIGIRTIINTSLPPLLPLCSKRSGVKSIDFFCCDSSCAIFSQTSQQKLIGIAMFCFSGV